MLIDNDFVKAEHSYRGQRLSELHLGRESEQPTRQVLTVLGKAWTPKRIARSKPSVGLRLAGTKKTAHKYR